MHFLVLALSFLAPATLLEPGSVVIFGEPHRFPRAVWEKIEPASEEQDPQIAKLSAKIPSLYPNQYAPRGLPFRPLFIYERLLGDPEHLFFVFKDPKGRPKGYIHAYCPEEGNGVLIDELMVEEEWKNQRVREALFGRVLWELSQRNIDKKKIRFLNRDLHLGILARPYGIYFSPRGFPSDLITQHMLSRFSLDYLNKLDPKNSPPLSKIAQEIKEAIKKAKKEDGFRTCKGITEIDWRVFLKQLQVKYKQEQAQSTFYTGIQADKMHEANLIFLKYLLSVQAQNDPHKEDRHYYRLREKFLLWTEYELGEAQREGGLFPSNLQILVARLHAFVPHLELRKGGEKEVEQYWKRRSLHWYLGLIHLTEIEGRSVLVMPALIYLAMREVLGFCYPANAANTIMNRFSQAMETFQTNGGLTLEERERKAVELFLQLQKKLQLEDKINLESRYGFLFLFGLRLYLSEEPQMQTALADFVRNGLWYVYLSHPLDPQAQILMSLIWWHSADSRLKGIKDLSPTQRKRFEWFVHSLTPPHAVDLAL